MKYTTLPYDDSLTHGPVRVIVDKESDIKDLPKDFSAGSKAIVAESGKTYLLNNKQEWKKQPVSTGGSNNAASEISIVQTIDSSSAQDAVPSAKAVYDFVSANALFIEARENNGQVILNKTFDEIANAFYRGGSCKIVSETNGATAIFSVSEIILGNNMYFVRGISLMGNGPTIFGTNSMNGYPILNYEPEEEGDDEEGIHEIHLWLTPNQNNDIWNWTADDPSFNVNNFISMYSNTDSQIYVKIGNYPEGLARVLWDNSAADSDVLVISETVTSGASYIFSLQDTDHTATLLEILEVK